MLFCHSMSAGWVVGTLKPCLLQAKQFEIFALTGGRTQKHLTHALTPARTRATWWNFHKLFLEKQIPLERNWSIAKDKEQGNHGLTVLFLGIKDHLVVCNNAKKPSSLIRFPRLYANPAQVNVKIIDRLWYFWKRMNKNVQVLHHCKPAALY